MIILGKWWEGQRCTCRKCGEKFELEVQDKPTSKGPYFANVHCPTCKEPVNVTVPFTATVPI